MKREYPERPIVGVGGVIFQEEAVLLVRRDQEPGKGQWSLPGGVVELGESLSDTLRRELWEEVLVRIQIGGQIGTFDRIICDQEDRVQYHYVLVDFWGWVVSGDPRPASDVSEVRVVPLDELDMVEISLDLKEMIRRAISMRR